MVISSSQYTSASVQTTTATCSLGGGATAGDPFVFILSVDADNDTWTTPSGWSKDVTLIDFGDFTSLFVYTGNLSAGEITAGELSITSSVVRYNRAVAIVSENASGSVTITHTGDPGGYFNSYDSPSIGGSGEVIRALAGGATNAAFTATPDAGVTLLHEIDPISSPAQRSLHVYSDDDDSTAAHGWSLSEFSKSVAMTIMLPVGTPPTAPGAPTGLTATAGNAEVDLSWTAPASDGGSAITDYVVQWRTTSGPGSWNTFADGTSTATTTTVTGLTNGTSYDFQVAAVNSVGQGSYSATDTATPTGGGGGPGTYEVLAVGQVDTPVAVDVSLESVIAGFADTWNVTWIDDDTTPPSLPGSYDLVLISESVQSTSANVSGTYMTADIPVLNMEALSWDEGTEDIVGTTGSVTNNVWEVIDAAAAAHPIMTALGWTDGQQKTVNSGATNGQFSQKVEFGAGVDLLMEPTSNPTGCTVWAAETGAALNTGTATNLRAGIGFQAAQYGNWSVDGQSLIEQTMRWLVGALDTVQVPESVSVSPGNTELVVTWSAPSSGPTPSSYDLQHRVNPAGGWTLVTGVTSPHTITGLVNGTAYDVQVRSVGAGGSSEVSDDFNRANGTPGSDWVEQVDAGESWDVVSNQMAADGTNITLTNTSVALSDTDQQWAEVEIGGWDAATSWREFAPVVRMRDDAGDRTGYMLYTAPATNTGTSDFRVRIDFIIADGSRVGVSSYATGLGDLRGSKVAIAVSGSSLKGYVDGVEVVSGTDTNLPDNDTNRESAGLWNYTAADIAYYDNFRAGTGPYLGTGGGATSAWSGTVTETPAAVTTYEMLYVGKDPVEQFEDATMVAVLEGLTGVTVNSTYHDVSNALPALGPYDFVFISAAVSSTEAESHMTAAIPILHAEADAWDGSAQDYHSAGGAGNSGNATFRVSTGADVHPIISALGWADNDTKIISSDNLNGRYVNAADLRAGVDRLMESSDASTEVTVFAVDSGADLNGTPASDKRAGFGLLETEYDTITADGEALLTQMILWLVGGAVQDPNAGALTVSATGVVTVTVTAARPNEKSAGPLTVTGGPVVVTASADRSGFAGVLTISGSVVVTAGVEPCAGLLSVDTPVAATVSVSTQRNAQTLSVAASATVAAEATGRFVIVEIVPKFIIGAAPSAAYRTALLTGAEHQTVIELLSDNDEVVATTDRVSKTESALVWGASGGSLTYDRKQRIQREFTLNLSVPSAQATTFVPRNTASLLHPRSGNRVRVWGGYQLADGNKEMFVMGTFVVASASASSTSGMVQMQLLCREALEPLTSNFETSYQIADGTNVVDAVVGILRQVMDIAVDGQDGRVQVTTSSTLYTTPAIDIEPGENRREIVDQLLDAIGYEIRSDERGNIIIEPISETSIAPESDPRWEYGSVGVPARNVESVWATVDAPSGVSFVGGARTEDTDPIEAQVWDSDPTSATYKVPTESSSTYRVDRVDNDFVRTVQQGVYAGFGYLRRNGRGGDEVVFETNPNPALRANDIVRFCDPDLGVDEQLWRVARASIPLSPGGYMTVELHGSWDPSINSEIDGNIDGGTPPPAPSPTLISDDFNRPDENTEANVNWTEHQWSWGLESNQSVQRYPGWSLARWVTPFQSTDHFAEITVTDINYTTNEVGPFVRSSGQFQGYGAMAHNNGNLTIKKFTNNQPVANLGTTWAEAGGFSGKTIRLEVEGNELRAYVNAVLRITVTDTSYPSGTFVGMAGRGDGGTGSANSVKVDDFAGGEV